MKLKEIKVDIHLKGCGGLYSVGTPYFVAGLQKIFRDVIDVELAKELQGYENDARFELIIRKKHEEIPPSV